MSRRRAAACALTLASVVSACAVQEQRQARIRNDDDVPFGLLDEAAPPLLPPAPGPVTDGVSLCFLEGDRLRVVVTAPEPGGELTDVVRALADPPEGQGNELRTAVGDPPLVADVSLTGGVARVDLLPAITSLSGDEQLFAVAQLVCTLTGQPGVGPVSFTLEGANVDVPRGDGSLTSESVSRDDYADLLGGEDP